MHINIHSQKYIIIELYNLFYRCALVHAARNGHLSIVAYLLACDWVLANIDQEVSLTEAAQQALVAAAAQGHTEVGKNK